MEDRNKELYLENKAKREKKKIKKSLVESTKDYVTDNYELNTENEDGSEVTPEEKEKFLEQFMRGLGNIPFINDLADKAANRLEKRAMKKAEKRGQKIAKKMNLDREEARILFTKTLLEKVKQKNEELARLKEEENSGK